MSLDKLSRAAIIQSSSNLPRPYEESGEKLRRLLSQTPRTDVDPIADSLAGLAINPPMPESTEVTGDQSDNTTEAPVEPSSSNEEWSIDFGDLTKTFPDPGERERIRKLINSAKGTASHSANSRIELATIKSRLEQDREQKVVRGLSQTEIDRVSKALKERQAGA